MPAYVPTGRIDAESPAVSDANGIYRYIQATNELRRGDVVFWQGQPVGVAIGTISPGNYGFVQVSDVLPSPEWKEPA